MSAGASKAQPDRQGFGARAGERDQADRERMVRARKQGDPKRGYISWGLTIPSPVVRDITEAGAEVTQFSFLGEMVPEGILFRIVERRGPAGTWNG